MSNNDDRTAKRIEAWEKYKKLLSDTNACDTTEQGELGMLRPEVSELLNILEPQNQIELADLIKAAWDSGRDEGASNPYC